MLSIRPVINKRFLSYKPLLRWPLLSQKRTYSEVEKKPIQEGQKKSFTFAEASEEVKKETQEGFTGIIFPMLIFFTLAFYIWKLKSKEFELQRQIQALKDSQAHEVRPSELEKDQRKQIRQASEDIITQIQGAVLNKDFLKKHNLDVTFEEELTKLLNQIREEHSIPSKNK